MRPHIQQQAAQSWSSGAQLQYKFGAQAFWTTGIGLGLEVAYTQSTTPAVGQDWLARYITAISVYSGKNTYLAANFRDMRAIYWEMRYATRGFKMPDFIATNGTVYWLFPILFHPFAVHSSGRFDPTGYLSARDGKRMAGIEPDSTFEMDITLNTTNGLQASGAVTLTTSGKIRPILFGLEYDAGDGFALPVFKPKFTLTSATPDQTYSGEGWQVKVPQGDLLHTTLVMPLVGSTSSDADIRSNGYGSNVAISEFSIQTSDSRKPVDVKVWDANHLLTGQHAQVADDNGDLQAATSVTGGTSVVTVPYNPGIIPVRWADHADSTKVGTVLKSYAQGQAQPKVDPDYGADLRATQDTAVVFKETVDVTSDVVQAMFNRKYAFY